MQQMTIKETLNDKSTVQAQDYRIYVIRDAETAFYVGQSVNTYNRLLQHLGTGISGMSHVGEFIEENAPASDDWLFEQYTLEDCREFIPQDMQDFYEKYGHSYDVNDAEIALISLYHPCLNSTCDPNPLPIKYTHVRPNASSGQYLKV